jgi:hypothetical protein
VDGWHGVHSDPQSVLTRAYNDCMTYEILCPSAPEQNETATDLDRAMLLCLDLSEEFGYAEIRDSFGNIVGDYGDPSTFL